MEIHISHIGMSAATGNQLSIEIARVLHHPEYAHHIDVARPINLKVHIFRKNPRYSTYRFLSGALTVPTVAIGNQFLQDFGGQYPSKSIVIGQRIKFEPSRGKVRQDIVEELRRMPYADPRVEEEEQALSAELKGKLVALETIQFGWQCRDNVFSAEWEKLVVLSCNLNFDNERREFRIEFIEFPETRIIAIRAAQISWVSAGYDLRRDPQRDHPVIYITLKHAPSYETSNTEARMHNMSLTWSSNISQRQRWSAFDNGHEAFAPYTSIALRLVCRDPNGLRTFHQLCHSANLHPEDYLYPVERRGLFSLDTQAGYQAWLSKLQWPVAFQVEAITRGLLVDLQEMMRLRTRIERLVRLKGVPYTCQFLRHFATQAKTAFWYTEDTRPTETVEDLYNRCTKEFVVPTRSQRRGPIVIDSFDCLHVTVTPTTLRLEGPYPERSNRIMRQYPGHHDSFLRVNFVDENDLQFRFDRDVDGHAFTKRRVGCILEEGVSIAGRHFEFLAYSQSALKEHAVWFVKEFKTSDGRIVNASSIIKSIGVFDNLPSDPRLIYCPARYGARISQAFTATDSSGSVEAEEVFELEDIKDAKGKWCFTDGVGTISLELAEAIWRELRSRRRSARKIRTHPRAFQIRFMGSKGMVSVDHRLKGRAIGIRESMVKFEAPNSLDIEIARAFHRPGPFYLNRPLIMILENLGVPYKVFQDLQKTAVKQAQQSVQSLESSAKLLETYGLGTSFKLTSVMLHLSKLGLDPLNDDQFWRRMMDFAINHVLRELKHHARIPVAGGWNLVGVADIHGYLKEGEVFACIVPTEGAPIYLEGPTMVSRSPTIHPGDVQIAHAIGRPPPGSPFEIEPLKNTLVFSVRGSRPLPSYLGGGDLDGDEYRVTMITDLLPPNTYPPADYEPAVKRFIDHPSTMKDVAEFVTEFINSDSLGIIAITWLVIADQSTKGVFDEDCMLLSALHSDAVDYPKSGNPVPLHKLPKSKFRIKPDWNAPETVSAGSSKRFYKSERWIGRLFREIDLPAIEKVKRAERSQRPHLGEGERYTIEEVLDYFHDTPDDDMGELYEAVLARVSSFVPVGRYDDDIISEMWELYMNYQSQLRTICADHTLSHDKFVMLTEEEVTAGTIVAKCSQPRKRKDLMSKMRENATELVDRVRDDIAGEEGMLLEDVLKRSWTAFRLAVLEDDAFGARSFMWLVLGEIFDTIKSIEDEMKSYF